MGHRQNIIQIIYSSSYYEYHLMYERIGLRFRDDRGSIYNRKPPSYLISTLQLQHLASYLD